jgi:hypothetical protein
MPESHSPRMIEQSRCPKCEIRMMLVGVEPSYAGPDLRTLECPKCELAYKALAEEQRNREQSGLAQKRGRLISSVPEQTLAQCPSKFQMTANGAISRMHVMMRRPMRFIEYSAKSRQRGTMPYQRSRGSR